MAKKYFFIIIILLPFISQAQFGNFVKKTKDKLVQGTDKKVDNEIDKKLDQLEGKQPASGQASANTPPANQPATPVPNEEKPGVKAFSKFDFVPGERILYAEDFSQDAIGELPLTWNSSGKGEVMTMEGKQGKWLRIFQNNSYLTGNKTRFGENYTIEFDLLFYFEPKVKGYVLPGWSFGLFSSGTNDATANQYLKERSDINSTEVRFGFGSYALAVVESREKRGTSFLSDKMTLGEVLPNFNKIIHYSIQVQKSRFRLWIDEKKVFDIPRAINTTDTMNQVFFKMEGSNYKEDEIGMFVTNLKIATGIPDTRHKLIEEGKFSTTGILFDVNAATIKPESAGVLKQVSEVLKSSPGIKIKIIGHTDSDGADAANLELSKKRAEAVKSALVNEYGIEESSVMADGKGETKPVADNKTREGKAQNRRVEFLKL
jgi:OmpA-OmpF porin, OOP family